MMSVFLDRLAFLLGVSVLAGVFAACDAPELTPSSSSTPVALAPIDTAPRNVLWIVLDACRADRLSCYGYHLPTSPNIDAVAERGVIFEHNFSQAPATAPSVPIYMTGRTNAVAYQDPGGMGLWFFRKPPPEEKLVSTIFRENGYLTGMFSASPWYTEHSPLAKSFDEFYWLYTGEEPVGETYREQNPPIFQWLEQRASRPDEPFFMYLHTLDTHGPRYHRNTDPRWLDPDFPKERDKELRVWGARAVQNANLAFSARDQAHIGNLYDGGVRHTDAMMGEVFDHLERLGLAGSTVVIISSDHGELLGQDGASISHPPRNSVDDLLHVPLIVAGPGIPEGHRVSTMTQSADIVPTLVDLLGMDTAAVFHGRSLRPLMESADAGSFHPFVYARTDSFTMLEEPTRILVYDDYKFDFSPIAEDAPIFPNMTRRPQRLVYAMPDRLGARRVVQPPADRLAEAERALAELLMPRWKTKDDLPRIIPPLFQLPLPAPYLYEEITTEHDDPADNRWTRTSTSDSVFSHENVYIAYPFSETPKGLIFVFNNIPNARYDISVFSSTLPAHPDRGAAFKLYVPDADDEGTVYRLPPSQSSQPTSTWHEIGRYPVTEEKLTVWVNVANPDDVAVIGSFRFRVAKPETDPESTETMEERLERLRSLGYVQ